MLNAYSQFSDLVPLSKVDVVTILSHNGDGSMTVETLNGDAFRAFGVKVTVGDKAYLDTVSRRVISDAPNLPVVPVTLF